MKIDLSGLSTEQQKQIRDLADAKGFSVRTLVVQALRLYADTDKKLSDGEICSWSGDAARASAFSGTRDHLKWDNGAEHWDYPLVARHNTSGSLVLFHAPGCGTMLRPGGEVLTKAGDFGSGYAMDDFTRQSDRDRKDAEQRFALSLRAKWHLEGLDAMREYIVDTANGRN